MFMKSIIGLENYSTSEIELSVQQHLNSLKEKFVFEGLDFSISSISFFGSRIYGKPKKKSDLDVKIKYFGKAREDDLFNALNNKNNRLHFENILVDFYPEKVFPRRGN